jgi:hypothetical protein
MVLAQMIVDAPNHGAIRRAAAISAPSDAAPTTAATSWMRRVGMTPPERSAEAPTHTPVAGIRVARFRPRRPLASRP